MLEKKKGCSPNGFPKVGAMKHQDSPSFKARILDQTRKHVYPITFVRVMYVASLVFTLTKQNKSKLTWKLQRVFYNTKLECSSTHLTPRGSIPSKG